MLPANVLYFGVDEPLPERTELRAGPLTCVYEQGGLRYIRLGDREILRRVYVAIRDSNWGTLPNVISDLDMRVDGDAFRISFDVSNRKGDIDFRWQGTIVGQADGAISFAMDGRAHTTFQRNRIGFCVLHPMRECAGRPCRVEKDLGSVQEGMFPKFIAPHQPFMDMRGISYPVQHGVRANIRFSGDVFEMEDQRNWTDASFKTYCTPLGLPFPVTVPEGTRISQSVTLALETTASASTRWPSHLKSSPSSISFKIGAEPLTQLPRIGLAIASHVQPPTATEIARLGALYLGHLWAELDLTTPDWETSLQRAASSSRALALPLEVMLLASPEVEDALHRLAELVASEHFDIKTWFVVDKERFATSESLAKLARRILGDAGARIGGGTNSQFTELNRNRPPVDLIDAICYPMNPQAHAFDNASIVETLETQGATVESARQFSGGLPLAVGPVTLRRRFNPVATGPASEPIDALPASVDARQMSLLGAAWTVGSLKYLGGQPAVEQLTYYETTGWRGVMELEQGAPLPALFPSLPGGVFPLYHILADVGEFAGGDVLPTETGAPLLVDGLALRRDGATRILLANLSSTAQRVTLTGLSERVRLTYLDERSAESAMRLPEIFRASPGELAKPKAGVLELELLPYATVRLDSLEGTERINA